MTLLVNYKIHIHIENFILEINYAHLLTADIILLVIFAADLAISSKSAVDINNIVKHMTEIKDEIAILKLKLKEEAEKSNNIEQIKKRINMLQSERSGIDKHMNFFKRNLINAHPRAYSTKFNNAFAELKDKISERKK